MGQRLIRARAFLALLPCALLGQGCATLYEGDCAHFERLRKETRYETVYTYTEHDAGKLLRQLKPLPAHHRAAAPLYQLHLDRTEVRPCSHLTLHKAVFLQRTGGEDLIFEEVREFYAEGGVRIVENRETLTAQFTTGGYYRAKIPLPIPAGAPPGQYRIVSKLLLKTRGTRTPFVLATSSAHFRVLTPQNK